MFENNKICSDCGGKCCKKTPGVCYPSDFDLPSPVGFEKLNDAIKSGRYCIDWWEGDPSNGEIEHEGSWYFVRPATKDKVGVKYDPSWGGECTFLGENGCDLEHDNRPTDCRLLEPVEGGVCVSHDGAGKLNASMAWQPYFNELDQ